MDARLVILGRGSLVRPNVVKPFPFDVAESDFHHFPLWKLDLATGRAWDRIRIINRHLVTIDAIELIRHPRGALSFLFDAAASADDAGTAILAREQGIIGLEHPLLDFGRE